MKVLVVCHGNINRSPLCAAVLRRERPDWEVREGALKSSKPGWRPERAAKKMRDEAMRAYGIDLEAHRSQAMTDADLEWADSVVFMDGGNYRRLQALRDSPGGGKQWVCLGSFANPPVSRIPDPNFMKARSPEFIAVVDLIYQASLGCARKMIAVDF